VLSSLEELRRAGEVGAEGGPLRLGWLRTRPAMTGGAWPCGRGRERGAGSGGGRMPEPAPLVDLENPLLGVWGCGGT
jgi:hypothetical protein